MFAEIADAYLERVIYAEAKAAKYLRIFGSVLLQTKCQYLINWTKWNYILLQMHLIYLVVIGEQHIMRIPLRCSEVNWSDLRHFYFPHPCIRAWI